MSQKQMKTFQKLFSALVTLAKEQPLSEIRVSDIAKTAGVHRATFYRHVENAQDLLERGTEYFWNDLIKSMEEVRLETHGQTTDSGTPEYLQHFFSRILDNSEILKAFLNQPSSNYFQTHTRQRMTDFVAHYRLIRVDDAEQKQHLAAMIGACLYVTIDLVVQKGSYEPYLKTYFSLLRQVNQLET